MKKLVILLTVIFVFGVTFGSLAWEAPYDFEGRTVTFDWRDDAQYVEYFEEGEGKAYLEEVEEKFNVNIEFTSTWPPKEIINDTLAGDAADVFKMERHFWEELAIEDVFMDLSHVLDDDYWERVPKVNRDAKDFYEFTGNYYSFPDGNGPDPEGGPIAYVLYWNRDLFEKENLPDLYELVEAKEWTWDQFRDIVDQVVDDTSGDGEIDQWGFSSGWTLARYALTSALYSNNASRVKVDENGYVEFALNEPEALEAIELMRELITDMETVPPPADGQGITGERTEGALEHFMNGDLAIFHGANWHSGALMEGMDDKWGVVPFPIGPNSDDYNVHGLSTANLISINTDEDPEALVELASALNRITEPYTDIDNYKEKLLEENYFQSVLDRESLMVYDELMAGNWKSERYDIFPDQQWYWETIIPILNGEKPVTATMDEIAPEMQAVLDDVLN